MMNQALDEQNVFRKYLLQELAEAEQERLEERLLTDGEFGRRLALAQDDLIDDFVAGGLSEPESESFRRNFLTTPARLEKLKFAMALDRYVATEATATTEPGAVEKLLAFFRLRPLRAAFSVVGAFLILGAAFFILLRLSGFQLGGGDDLRQEFARANRELETDSASLSELRRSSASMPVLSLSQNFVREDAEARTVEITKGVTLVRLLLEVSPGSDERFRAVLQNAAGDDSMPVENLRARSEDGARFVVLNVPSRLLKRGEFQLRLFGIHGDGRVVDLGLYPFRVTTR